MLYTLHVRKLVPYLGQGHASAFDSPVDHICPAHADFFCDFFVRLAYDIVLANRFGAFRLGYQAVCPPGGLDTQIAQIRLHPLKLSAFGVQLLYSEAHLVPIATTRRHPAQVLGAFFGHVPDALYFLLLDFDSCRKVAALLKPRLDGLLVRANVRLWCVGVRYPCVGHCFPPCQQKSQK